MKSRRRVNSTVMPLRFSKKQTKAARDLSLARAARLALRQTRSATTTPRLLVTINRKPEARYNLGRHNKSLDASGVSGLLIHNLSVAQSSAAASTQTLGCF
jgi:hypothetical protein